MKIVGLLFIVSFVKQHIQHPILSNVLILGLSAFLLFDFWKVFGGALFLFILVSFGVLHIMVDLSFLGAFQRHPSREEMEHAQREQEAQQRKQYEEAQARGEQGEYAPSRNYPGGMEEYEEDEGHGHAHRFSQGVKGAKGHGGEHASSSRGHAKSSGGALQHAMQKFLQQRRGGGHR